MKSLTLNGLDFETFYTSDYSLSKLTPIEYVYDPKFEIILVSWVNADGMTDWFSGTEEQTRQWLIDKGIEDSAIVAHNGSEFDHLILRRLRLRPKRYYCTLQMARVLGIADTAGGSLAALVKHFGLADKGDYVIKALGKRRADFSMPELRDYAGYASLDAILCMQLFHAMALLVPKDEWRIMHMHTKQLAEGAFVADMRLLRNYLATLEADRADTLADTGLSSDVIMSNPQFAALLESYGVNPPQKLSKTTGLLTYAFSKTDQEFLTLLEHEDERVASAVAARLKIKSTIEVTRTKRFIDTAELMNGIIPMPTRYCGAHTGRSSGAGFKLNPQNLSARNREPVLKKSLLAPPGKLVFASDSSQIEPRVLAWVAGQKDLLERFRKPKSEFDLYVDFASRDIYHVPETEIGKRERTVSKSAVIGAGYMMSAAKFIIYVKATAGLDITPDEAEHVINAYRQANDKIKGFWSTCKNVLYGLVNGASYPFSAISGLRLESDQSILLPSGRKLFYRGMKVLRDNYGQESFAYERRRGRSKQQVFVHSGLLTENIVQAIARDIVMYQAIQIDKEYPVLGTTHDEVFGLIPEDDADRHAARIHEHMVTGPEWAAGLPLAAETGFGKNYGEA